jgi:hypothetical protein
LYLGVLEREVNVAGGSWAEVGDFALNPHVGPLQLDQFANLSD